MQNKFGGVHKIVYVSALNCRASHCVSVNCKYSYSTAVFNDTGPTWLTFTTCQNNFLSNKNNHDLSRHVLFFYNFLNISSLWNWVPWMLKMIMKFNKEYFIIKSACVKSTNLNMILVNYRGIIDMTLSDTLCLWNRWASCIVDVVDIIAVCWSHSRLRTACNGHGRNFRSIHKGFCSPGQEAEIWDKSPA